MPAYGHAGLLRGGPALERYVGEPPRVLVRALRRPRAGRRKAIRFTLSKRSDVLLQVRDSRGRLELSRRLRALPHGSHLVGWVPPWSGRHRLRIVAVGPGGTRAVVGRTIRARPRRDPKRKLQAKRDDRPAAAGRTRRRAAGYDPRGERVGPSQASRRARRGERSGARPT